MRKILSIGLLTFRESVRTRLVAALAAVVALIIVGMPFILEGDGTPVGIARMTLLYPLGTAFAFLAVTAPWTAAAALASDVRGKTLQLVRVKPVRMWQLWLGKWLGLLSLNALLLACAFLGVLVRLKATGALESDDIRIAKRRIAPELPSLESQIRMMEENVAATYENGMAPRERRELRASLRRRLPYASASLRSGEKWEWHFQPRRLPREGEQIWLRLALHSDALSQKQPVARIYIAGDKGSPGQLAPYDIYDFSAREHVISLTAPDTAGSSRLDLTIANLGDKDAPPLMVQPRQGLFLLLRAGRLEANMARAYAILLSILALLLAIGLAAGAFFSLPVAVFASSCLIVAVIASAYAVSDPDLLDPESLGAMPAIRRIQFRASALVTRTMAAASAPALRPAPLSSLSASEWIPLRELLGALAGNGIAIPIILALASSLHLSRKELSE